MSGVSKRWNRMARQARAGMRMFVPMEVLDGPNNLRAEIREIRQQELWVVKREYTHSNGETRHHAGFPLVQESYLITIWVDGIDWYKNQLLGRRPQTESLGFWL
jgi:hypothetical protein